MTVPADDEDRELGRYRLSYCTDFVAPDHVYRSYVAWSRERILEALSWIAIPVHVVMGTADRRMGHDWPGLVQQAGAKVRFIGGADHFFDPLYELELHDEVVSLIQ